MLTLHLEKIKSITGKKGDFIDFDFVITTKENQTVLLSFDNDTATKIYEAIEQTLWHESEHQHVLSDRVVELEAKIEELEYENESLRDSLAETSYYRSW